MSRLCATLPLKPAFWFVCSKVTSFKIDFLRCTDFPFQPRCPDVSKIREKMIYASSKDELKKRLVGYAVEVQAADSGDLDMEVVVEKINRV